MEIQEPRMSDGSENRSKRLSLPPIQASGSKLPPLDLERSSPTRGSQPNHNSNSSNQHAVSSDFPSLPSSLGFSALEQKKDSSSGGFLGLSDGLRGSHYEESNIHENIPIEIELPDGTVIKKTVSIGETVKELKRILEVDYNIPYSLSNLYIGKLWLMDPLSLNDFDIVNEQKRATIEVRVKQTSPELKPVEEDKKTVEAKELSRPIPSESPRAVPETTVSDPDHKFFEQELIQKEKEVSESRTSLEALVSDAPTPLNSLAHPGSPGISRQETPVEELPPPAEHKQDNFLKEAEPQPSEPPEQSSICRPRSSTASSSKGKSCAIV